MLSENEWTIFENTHEAIIDQKTFEMWSRKFAANVRRYPNGWGERPPLQACCIVPIAAARCMSIAPTMAGGFPNIPDPVHQSPMWDALRPHNTVSMQRLS